MVVVVVVLLSLSLLLLVLLFRPVAWPNLDGGRGWDGCVRRHMGVEGPTGRGDAWGRRAGEGRMEEQLPPKYYLGSWGGAGRGGGG